MTNKMLLGVIGLLSLVLIIEVSFFSKTSFSFDDNKQKEEEPKNENNPKAELTIKIKNSITNEIEEIDFEDYIVGVVSSEMPALFHEEALKSQAIAARSYALYQKSNANNDYDVLTDVTHQVYSSKEQLQEKWGENYNNYYERVKSNVESTSGLVMTYNNAIIEAFYFAMSNGYTEDSQSVFSQTLPYINSVESPLENESLNNFMVTKTFNKNDFCSFLSIDCSSIVIEAINRSNTNRIDNITINQRIFSGVEIRKLLQLRSTDFEIVLEDNAVQITTKGYGHGVGMSQYGANEMAKQNNDYETILKHYYQNIEISKIY